MPITEDRILKLRQFGLSEYAARAYLALLDLGVTEARDISKLTRVPTSKIYHILEQLHEKGLVEILPEFPKKYAPVPFQEYLDKLQAQHEAAAESIERERDRLADLFSVVGTMEVGDRGNFTVVRGRRNVMEKLREMLGGARSDLLGLVTVGTAGRAAHFLDDFRAARGRGVRVRLLAPLTRATVRAFGPLAEEADIRARDVDRDGTGTNVAIVIADRARAIVVGYVPDDDSVYSGRDVALYTDQQSIVAALQTLVEPAWTRAEPYAARRAEVEGGKLAEATRLYTSAADGQRALVEALDRGVRELLCVDPLPAGAPTPAEAEVSDILARAGARSRALRDFDDAVVADVYAERARANAREEARHLAPRAMTRSWVVDDREALFCLAPEGAVEAAVYVHTTRPATVVAVRAQFERLWRSAVPVADRARELAARGAAVSLTPKEPATHDRPA